MKAAIRAGRSSCRDCAGGDLSFAFSLNFAAFDWFMSLEPNWYSTMFGVRLFATSAVLSFALNILVALGLRRAGISKGAIHVEHFHDLGKLLFGFLVFWAYISFSEFFLIWYAAIPRRPLLPPPLGHRLVADGQRLAGRDEVHHPVFLILSRNAKRNLGCSAWARAASSRCTWSRCTTGSCRISRKAASRSPPWLAHRLGCMFACVGLYLAVVFRRMLEPCRDPRTRSAAATRDRLRERLGIRSQDGCAQRTVRRPRHRAGTAAGLFTLQLWYASYLDVASSTVT
jgi:hypothetical protein